MKIEAELPDVESKVDRDAFDRREGFLPWDGFFLLIKRRQAAALQRRG